MVQLNLANLFKKLNPLARKALDEASALSVRRTHYNVEMEHWLIRMLDSAGSDLVAVLDAYEVDSTVLHQDLTRALDRLKTGNAKGPGLSLDVVEMAREAWTLGTIQFGSGQIRTGHLLCALLSNDSLNRAAFSLSKQFEKLSIDSILKNFPELCSNTEEDLATTSLATGSAPGAGSGGQLGANSKTPSLDQFTIDLTARAREGKIDAVLGRDHEIRQVIDILTRRRQNNPILTGEAGVGKTAVVEGFALRIAAGDVPEPLRDVALRTLDLGLLQAGAGVKGEFENRLKSVIDEVKASPKPIILFIDEAHTLIGAGGSAGQGDAANLLKPALARGELRTVAATTWAEYKKYFEKDAALARRFQTVKVEEPSEATAIEMIRGLTAVLEKHHRVRILDEAIVDAVKLSHRYISGRQLPDKAVSLIDTACARINLSQSSTPPAVEDAMRRLDHLHVARDILLRESVTGANHDEQLKDIEKSTSEVQATLDALQIRWQQEKELVTAIQELGCKLEGIDPKAASQALGKTSAKSNGAPAASKLASSAASGTVANGTGQGAATGPGAAGKAGAAGSKDAAAAAPPGVASKAGSPDDKITPIPLTPEQREQFLAELKTMRQALAALQDDEPLVHPCVDRHAVASTVAAWTGIPVGRMVADEIQTVLNLRDLMEQQIVGQSHALERIAQSIRTSRAQLNDPRAPIGVFLLAGTSGVGKTETAITLAQLLYGGEQNMTVINMSEYKEEHKVSLLMGSPPGYVGYGEGGVLTEAVRRKPYSVVLLDEMEKAHPGIQDVFYQVFDKGTMKDGEGRDIDFKNTVIIMTSNAGTDLIKSLCSDPDTAPEPDAFIEALFPELLKTFKPAFLGRLTVIPYYPLKDEVIKKIVGLKLGKIGKRVRENYRAEFGYTPDLVATIAERCREVDTGARNIDHILTRSLLPEMSSEILGRLGEGKTIQRVQITVGPDQRFQYQIS